MVRWISARLDESFEVMVQALRQRPPHLYDTSPLLVPLHPKAPIPGALWILWSDRKQQTSSSSEEFEEYKKGLEMLLEVEYKEHLYFHRADEPLGPELREAITNGDGQALPTLLNTARMAADASFTFWGDAANGAIEIEWHMGATETGFNLELPVGQGVGGRSFALQEAIHVDDYLNSPYRHPGVRDDVDKQGTRTVLSVPLRGQVPGAGAILYGAMRRVYPFSAAQRILLSRLARSVEPLVGERQVSRFYRIRGEKASPFTGEDESPTRIADSRVSLFVSRYNAQSATRVSATVFDNRILPVERSRSARKRFADERPRGCENQALASKVYFRLGGRGAYGLLKRSRRGCKTTQAKPGTRTSEKRESSCFSKEECQVHPKTVRYRTRRAEEILGKDLASPTDRTALSMAAFVWTNRQRNQSYSELGKD